jgi:hypothetical protein
VFRKNIREENGFLSYFRSCFLICYSPLSFIFFFERRCLIRFHSCRVEFGEKISVFLSCFGIDRGLTLYFVFSLIVKLR